MKCDYIQSETDAQITICTRRKSMKTEASFCQSSWSSKAWGNTKEKSCIWNSEHQSRPSKSVIQNSGVFDFCDYVETNSNKCMVPICFLASKPGPH